MARTAPLKILFVLQHAGFTRFFESTIIRLVERGHHVHLALSQSDWKTKGLEGLEAYAQTNERLIIDRTEFPVRTDLWKHLTAWTRSVHDYLLFLDSRYNHAGYLRSRSGERLPEWANGLQRAPHLPPFLARLVRHAWGWLEHVAPPAPEVDAHLRRIAPDVLVVTPLIGKHMAQTDLMKSARAAGIPAGLCVASWDNLSCKGLIHVKPDRLFLWNATQHREAVDFHGLAPGRVTVTGAQPFDIWFDREPTITREEFCRRVGLPPDRPYVLFTASSPQINGPEQEAEIVRRWIEAVRATPEGRELSLLIRPHPVQHAHLEALDRCRPDVVVYPAYSINPVAPEDRADYFHSIYFSSAVVGINTSAMVEATILNRPVLTVLVGDLSTQGETLHFRYLLPENGGFLIVANDFEEHARQLAEVVRSPAAQVARLEQFVGHFLRPRGRDVAAVEHLVEGIEGLASLPVRPRTAPALAGLLRRLVEPRLPQLTRQAVVEEAERLERQQRKVERQRAREARQAAKEAGRPASGKGIPARAGD